MKVKEAIELLKGCNPDNELVVARPERGGIGVPAHDKIKDRSFNDGFDWGMGYTFINVESKAR